MSDHLGDAVTALVDGQLDHPARERVLGHLAHCAPCRGEVEAHRRLKASLTRLRALPVEPSPDLAARLLAAAATRPATPPPSTRRGPRRPRGAARPPVRPLRARPSARRGAAAGVLLAVGLAGALALGAPDARRGARTPVDPASPAFVTAYVETTSEVPLTEPAFATVVPASASRPGR